MLSKVRAVSKLDSFYNFEDFIPPTEPLGVPSEAVSSEMVPEAIPEMVPSEMVPEKVEGIMEDLFQLQVACSNVLYDINKRKYTGCAIFGNLVDHGKELINNKKGKSVYNVEIVIQENETIVTSGYYFDTGDINDIAIIDRIVKIIDNSNGELIMNLYESGNFGVFGNTRKYENQMKNLGGKFNFYLLLDGPTVVYTNVVLFSLDDQAKLNEIENYIFENNNKMYNMDINEIDEFRYDGMTRNFKTLINPYYTPHVQEQGSLN